MYADSNNVNTQFFWVQEFPQSAGKKNKIHRRHANKANVAFADGRAEGLDLDGFARLPNTVINPSYCSYVLQVMYLEDYW
jgi:prepilin-type processing-associated H-X9-DG protein